MNIYALLSKHVKSMGKRQVTGEKRADLIGLLRVVRDINAYTWYSRLSDMDRKGPEIHYIQT